MLNSCIDHAYSNSPEKIQTSVCHVGDSDHAGIIVEKAIRVKRCKPKVVKKRSYKFFNVQAFLTDINTSDINKLVVEEKDINKAAEIFEKKFKEVLDKHAKIKVFQQRKNYLPYLSEETKQTMADKKVVMREASKSNDKELLKEGKRLGRVIKCLIKEDETKYYEENLNVQIDPRGAWKVANTALNMETNHAPTSIRVTNAQNQTEIVTNPLKLANLFNTFFTDKTKKLREKVLEKEVSIPPEERLQAWINSTQVTPPGFEIKEINNLQLREVWKKFKPKKVHGVDWIDAYSLKLAGPLIEEAILHLINQSIRSGIFAESWKPQLILPTWKKNERELTENYRPVSHIVQIGKLAELAVHPQVYEYFEKNHLFHPHQYGAIKNHSTATAVIHVHERWLETAEKNLISASCYLDQTAAYDLLSHQVLEKKLELYKFDKISRQWIASYLGGRSQSVQVESKTSDVIKGGDYGTPQGSELGGLLHVINCNDLPGCHSEGDAVVFIDDETDNVAAAEIEILKEKIQEEAGNSELWLKDNQLCVSGEKSKLMVVATNQLRRSKVPYKVSIEIDGKEVPETNSERLLGIVTSNDFSWKGHLYGDGSNKGLIQKLAQRVGIIKKLSYKMNKERLRIFTEGIFYSTLKYGLQVFGNVFGLEKYKETGSRYSAFTQAMNHDLQVLQNKVNRILLRKWRDISTEELCLQTKSLSVQQMVASSTLNTALKILRTKKPTFLYSKFNLNQRSTAFIQPLRKSICREGFVDRAISLLNMAGASLRHESTEKVSKKMVNDWVKKHIDIKPKPSSKNFRFQQVQQKQNRVAETDLAVFPNSERQRQITDFFTRT